MLSLTLPRKMMPEDKDSWNIKEAALPQIERASYTIFQDAKALPPAHPFKSPGQFVMICNCASFDGIFCAVLSPLKAVDGFGMFWHVIFEALQFACW